MAEEMEQIVDNLKQPSSWIRVLFMIGFAVLLYVIIAPVIFVLMIVQALFVLLTGEVNSNLKYLGAALTKYVAEILQFISYNSEHKPFPFADFPAIDPEAESAGEAEAAGDDTPSARHKPASRKKATSRKVKKTDSDTSSEQDPE